MSKVGKAGKRLQRFLESTDKRACELFKEAGEVVPMWDMEDAQGNRYLAVTPFVSGESKNAAADAIRGLIRKWKIMRYAFITEAWVVEAQPEALKDVTALAARSSLQNHPDRREVLTVMVEDRGGAAMTRTRYILRPEQGHAKLSPPEDREATSAAGRFVGMFEPEREWPGA